MVETGLKVNRVRALQDINRKKDLFATITGLRPTSKARHTRSEMFRSVIRWAGYALLGAAMVVGILDAARSLSASTLDISPLGHALFWLLPHQFPLLEPAIVRHLHPFLWDPVLINLLLIPAGVVFLVLGGLMLWLGRPSAPPPLG